MAVKVGAVEDGLDALVAELELGEAGESRDVTAPARVRLAALPRVLLLGDARRLGAGGLAAVRVPVPLVARLAADLAATGLGQALALLAQVEVLGALLLLATLALVVAPVGGAAALAVDPPELVRLARVVVTLLDATTLAAETLEDVARGARAALVVLLGETAAGRAVPPPALGALPLGLTGRTETVSNRYRKIDRGSTHEPQ